jgi:hypothetical protein
MMQAFAWLDHGLMSLSGPSRHADLAHGPAPGACGKDADRMGDTTGIDFDHPDETRSFENGTSEIVHVGEDTIARLTLQPGWHWADHVKPIVGTDSCQLRHVGYMVSGRLTVKMDDGTETTTAAGQAYVIAPGHDAWAIGDEPVVALEFNTRSAESYAKPT